MHYKKYGAQNLDTLNIVELYYEKIDMREQRCMVHSAGYSHLMGANLKFSANGPSLGYIAKT